MSLERYRKKREFSKTPEPEPKPEHAAGKYNPIFVVQEHHARRLHYDFRLEVGGVLKSWAVPKGVPLHGERRLAVQTEDHPLEYAKFHGKIPEGLYGAGTVKIWDSGKYVPEKIKPREIIVELRGKKLKGKYVLIKTKFAKNSWLLFRKKWEICRARSRLCKYSGTRTRRRVLIVSSETPFPNLFSR